MLGKFPAQAEEAIPRLLPMLEDPDDAVVVNAAGALGLFGHRAEEADRTDARRALTRALIDCKSSVEEAMVMSLNRVTPDLDARLTDYFAELDPELLPLAREAFGLPVAPDLEADADDDPLWDEEIDR